MNYRIKQLLKEKGVSVNELAERTKMKRESVSRIINGANTTTETLSEIAGILGVQINDLFQEPATDTVNCPHCGNTIKLTK